MRWNHNINFIPSNIKVLAFVWYITNYVAKNNCNQYQYFMEVGFIYKVFNDGIGQLDDREPIKQIQFVDGDKFASRIFNQLIYNQEIIRFFTASSILKLLEYYSW